MASLSTQVSLPPGVLFRDLEGEAVILELESGRYFGLNETGTRIWLLLQKHRSMESAFQAMLDEYEVDAARLRKELLDFVDTLSARRLLEMHEPPEN